MKAIIIEDEPRAARQLELLLKENHPEVVILEKIQSVAQGMKWFRQNDLPDVIFSDIQLGDGTAFEIYRDLENIPPVIFTTAYDDYALKAFRANGMDYLLKPVEEEELKQAIAKTQRLIGDDSYNNLVGIAEMLKNQTKIYKSRFLVKVGEKIVSIPVDSITCIYSLMKASYIRTAERRNYAIEPTLDQVEKSLDPAMFFRVNRKMIVRFSAIEIIHTVAPPGLEPGSTV
jgi:two-component system response regulator LytT